LIGINILFSLIREDEAVIATTYAQLQPNLAMLEETNVSQSHCPPYQQPLTGSNDDATAGGMPAVMEAVGPVPETDPNETET
jgi:hypothetical protein